MGNDAVPQLYDVSVDPGETTNLAERHPDRVREMAAMLREIRESPKSRR